MYPAPQSMSQLFCKKILKKGLFSPYSIFKVLIKAPLLIGDLFGVNLSGTAKYKCKPDLHKMPGFQFAWLLVQLHGSVDVNFM